MRGEVPRSIFEEALLNQLEYWEAWVEKSIVHCLEYLDARLVRLKIQREREEWLEEGEERLEELRNDIEEVTEAIRGIKAKDRASGVKTAVEGAGEAEGDEKAKVLEKVEELPN